MQYEMFKCMLSSAEFSLKMDDSPKIVPIYLYNGLHVFIFVTVFVVNCCQSMEKKEGGS